MFDVRFDVHFDVRKDCDADLDAALSDACARVFLCPDQLYTDIVFAHLNAAARAALEAEMQLENYEYQSEFMRNLVARVDAESTGRAIFAVFEARGIPVDAETRERILACRDPEQLRVWLTAAVTVADAASIF